MNHDTRPLTTHEHVKFDDGSHLVVHSSPGGVQITGYLAGAWTEEAWDRRTAMEQARLLEVGAVDAPWSLPGAQARRLASAINGAAHAADEDEGPHPAGAPPGSERISLDGGHADVETVDEHVEVTVSIGQRIGAGLALSAVEADRIGSALKAAAHRAHVAAAVDVDLAGVETVTDLWRRAEETGTTAAALIEHVDRA